MKSLPDALAERLRGRQTTLALCWIVTRSDGTRLGFTEHDRALLVDGVLCHPENGLETTARTAGPGFAVGGGEVAGALSGPRLSEDDLEAGLWDGARVRVFIVDWSNPSASMCLSHAHIGEVSRQGQAFQAELRSLSHALEARYGRVYSRGCDASLGDARCKVSLTSSAYSGTATVISMTSTGDMNVSGLEGFQAGWFTGGALRVEHGSSAGFVSEIAGHRREDNLVYLSLWQAPPQPFASGTDVKVSAGCDKCFETCRAKFSNHLNFQGFPHMPGADFVLSYPNRNTGENDGNARIGSLRQA